MFCYLFYLPARQRSFSLAVRENALVLRCGVFSSAQRVVPFESIQFARLSRSPLHGRWGLCTLVVVCAGGRMHMPGLEEAQARGVLGEIFGGEVDFG